MSNQQVSSGAHTVPMKKKKKSKSRAGIYIALVVAFVSLFGVGVAFAVMFFGFNASLLGIASSVDSQNDKIDELSDEIMMVKEKVEALEVAPPAESLTSTSSSSSSTSSSSRKKTGYEITSLDSVFDLYTDYDLGFEIKIPKIVDVYDADSNLIETTVEVIREDDSVRFAPKDGLDNDAATWDIKVYDNATKKTVEQHFLDINDECDVVVYEDVAGKEYQSPRAESSDKTEDALGFPKCFLNYAAGSFYSEEEQVFAYWAIGQDARFYLDGEALDDEMRDSFEFID